jgi:serine/threonine-protein kinase CHEK1
LHTEAPIFAVKFINKSYAQKYGRIKQKQLQLETTLHKHVGMHRNIIEFYDSGEDHAWMWIAMELAEGGDLFDKIEADSGVSEDIAHVYFTQLINAIGYMHSKGVGHRDIKPENILLSADGDLKLADFGMATLFEYHGKRKMAATLCGSPPYVAPEVLSCSTHDGGKGIGYSADIADIWSCGVVLFVLLAGNTPWSKPVEGHDEYGRPNEFLEYIQSKGKPSDELWDNLPLEVLSLLRGMMKVDVASRFSLTDVRRHPWFTRSNKYMDNNGRLIDSLSMATNMFEALHVSLEADPLACMQRSINSDSMDIDQMADFKAALSSTQPEIPAEDMLFDWDKMSRLAISSTQPMGPTHGLPSTQTMQTSDFLADEPSMSQFTMTPSVPISRTQMARKFRDILPAQSLTKFYSLWTISLLVPLIVEALSRLGVPTPNMPLPSAQGTEYNIKVRTQDDRACPLTGRIAVEMIADGLVEVSFVKGSGDPLEWRRFFKRVTVLCKDAVYKPDE